MNNLGGGVWSTLLPLLGTALTRDPLSITFIAAATYLPWLLLSLPAGVLVDRTDPVKLMWRTQLMQSLVVALVAVGLMTGSTSIGLLCAAGFLLGVGDTLVGTATQVVLPAIVPVDHLIPANARQQVGQTASRSLLGPVVGGLLHGASAAGAVLVNAVSFLVSATILTRLGTRPARATGPVTRRPVVEDVAEGLRWLHRHRLLRALAAVLAVNCFCTQFAQALLVLLVTDAHGLSPEHYGLFLAATVSGGMLASLANPWLIRRLGSVWAIMLSLVLSAGAFIGVGWAPGIPALSVLLAVNAFATLLWNVCTVALRQRIVPSAVQGRITSTFAMLGWGLLPVGAVVGGLVAGDFGVGSVYPIAGVLRLLALIAVLPVLIAHRRVR
ncbi:major facilitator superfamily MFS_1 [Actinosynnema pretiosum subsp. pretiosum]|nr:major facilitator superfamily MFS_1 [Actinosynnema pretiosum subsp. pretiosum]